ncbi:hypothetical protein Hypma_000929 [Hypsizygus marmoreus]|uniref:Uncharacterized protein n=1 Tax=Hypsizygus marmoreus TaxID=39966 RepID=A0A369JDY7_HYPMA|nr:hypothetical protein Hypma_000929 [Hypsizygus marmoreus]
MAVLENNDQLGQLWTLIQELSEQLNQNRSLSVSLYTQAGNIKNQAVHSQTGFVLRRFNLDKTKEEYDAELERMNASMIAENQGLQHDNKQLNTLIKEYEQTLETLMSNFRNRAQSVQESELTLIREYETKLLARQEEYAAQDLSSSTALSESLGRISHLLRQFLRSLGGEDTDPPITPDDEEENREPWTSAAASDHALEREIELARLEKENEELRRMMGLVAVQPRRSISESRPTFEPPKLEHQRIPSATKLGGASGTVGPFGTYKRMRSPD